MNKINRLAKKGRRPALAHRRRSTPGSAPGELKAASGEPQEPLSLVGFSPEAEEFLVEGGIDQIADLRARWAVTWVATSGPVDVERLQKLQEIFALHSLALEDVVNLRQRPKVETFDDHFFVVLQVPSTQGHHALSQLSLFCGPGYVLTFQEEPADIFAPIRARISKGNGRVRRSDSSYLTYTIIDLAIDLYFPLLEQIGIELEAIEERLLGRPEHTVTAEIYDLRRTLMALRRATWPLREVITTLLMEDNEAISERTRVHLRDCRDHAAQILDLIEIYRETCAGLMEFYISSVGLRTNEVMRVLTIIATLFIPLTFIAGVYGMNFDPDTSPYNMPELRWAWGYPLVWGLMLLMVFAMLIYFRRKGWLGGAP